MKLFNRYAFALSVIFSLFTISGCAFLEANKQNIMDAGKAGAVVLSADELAGEIADYIAGDGVAINAMLQANGPVDYGLRTADFIKGNLDLPVIDVVLEYPEYLAEFKSKMLEGEAVLLDYAKRSTKPIPDNIQIMWANGRDAMRLFDKAQELHDRTIKLSRIYETVKPYAALGFRLGGIPLPINNQLQPVSSTEQAI